MPKAGSCRWQNARTNHLLARPVAPSFPQRGVAAHTVRPAATAQRFVPYHSFPHSHYCWPCSPPAATLLLTTTIGKAITTADYQKPRKGHKRFLLPRLPTTSSPVMQQMPSPTSTRNRTPSSHTVQKASPQRVSARRRAEMPAGRPVPPRRKQYQQKRKSQSSPSSHAPNAAARLKQQAPPPGPRALRRPQNARRRRPASAGL